MDHLFLEKRRSEEPPTVILEKKRLKIDDDEFKTIFKSAKIEKSAIK